MRAQASPPLTNTLRDLIRTAGKDVMLLANKCEGKAGESGLLDAYALGLDAPIAISAEHGNGIGDLLDAIEDWGKKWHSANPKAVHDTNQAEEEDEETPLRLAIVGRPNAGKSTFVNALLGEERLLTGPEAGLTRDAIALPFAHGDHHLELIDTAGLRRKARIKESPGENERGREPGRRSFCPCGCFDVG